MPVLRKENINYHRVDYTCTNPKDNRGYFRKALFLIALVKAQKYLPSTEIQDGGDPLSNCMIRLLKNTKINKY